jgi:hypothetical protein
VRPTAGDIRGVIRIDFAEGEACPLRDLPDSAGEQVHLVDGEAGSLADLVGNGEVGMCSTSISMWIRMRSNTEAHMRRRSTTAPRSILTTAMASRKRRVAEQRAAQAR